MNMDPSNIGRYRVLGELGRGSMGVVYLAEDPLLKRGVAIKAVRGAGTSKGNVLARFRKEAEISARIAHPNVVTIFDVGEAPGVGPFLAMEYVDGKPLSLEVAKGRLSPERAAILLVQAMGALEAAHRAGVIHRDVKPENFMISHGGLLKLMDFGIASQGEILSTTGLLCTPAFAAPEILNRQPPSESTDAWAFTVTAFQCLTGQVPFPGDSVSVVLYEIAHEPPCFPSDLDPKLAAIFQKALQKAPQDRYPDLRTFLRALLEAMPLRPDFRAHCLTFMESPESSPLVSTAALALGESRRAFRRLRPLHWVAMGSGALILGGLAWVYFTGWLFPRNLTINTTPPGARILVDDVERGLTPKTNFQIPSGARVVRVDKPGYLPLEVGLRPRDRVLNLILIPQPLTFAVRTDPPGAKVILNGSFRGITPLEGLSVPSEGLHRLLIQKDGFEPVVFGISSRNLPPERIVMRPIGLRPQTRPSSAPKPGIWDRIRGVFGQ